MAKKASNNVNFLSIYKTGHLGISHKEDGEGREQIETMSGDTRFIEKFNSTDDGYITRLQVVDKQFPSGTVKQLILWVDSGEAIDQIGISLLYSDGKLNEYVKSLITVLPNIDYSKRVCISPARSKNAKGYLNKRLYVNYTDAPKDDNLVELAHLYGDKGTIPGMEKKKDVTGKVTYDFTAQDTFLYNILTAELERFKTFRESNNPETGAKTEAPVQANTNTNTQSAAAPSTAAATATSEAPAAELIPEDELPF